VPRLQPTVPYPGRTLAPDQVTRLTAVTIDD